MPDHRSTTIQLNLVLAIIALSCRLFPPSLQSSRSSRLLIPRKFANTQPKHRSGSACTRKKRQRRKHYTQYPCTKEDMLHLYRHSTLAAPSSHKHLKTWRTYCTPNRDLHKPIAWTLLHLDLLLRSPLRAMMLERDTRSWRNPDSRHPNSLTRSHISDNALSLSKDNEGNGEVIFCSYREIKRRGEAYKLTCPFWANTAIGAARRDRRTVERYILKVLRSRLVETEADQARGCSGWLKW